MQASMKDIPITAADLQLSMRSIGVSVPLNNDCHFTKPSLIFTQPSWVFATLRQTNPPTRESPRLVRPTAKPL